MHICTIRLMLVIFCAAALAGCAKKDLVRSGEIAPSAESGRAEAHPDGHEAKEGMVDEKIMQDAAVREDPALETAERLPLAAILETVYFDFDSYLLSPEAREILARSADWLRKNSEAKVRIEGHCDERGSDAYNLALGERRANSSLQYLLNLGIEADRLSVVSYGEEKLAVHGHDEAAWAKNRRVELIRQD